MKRCTDTIEDHSSEPDSAFFRTRHADRYAACGIAIIRCNNVVIVPPSKICELRRRFSGCDC